MTVFMTVMCKGWFRMIFYNYKKLVQLNIMVYIFFQTGNYACGKAIDSVQLISFLDDVLVEVFIPNIWSQFLFFHGLDSLYRIQRWQM